MVSTYLTIICKSRKYNMGQWYGGRGRGGGVVGKQEKEKKQQQQKARRSDHKSQ